MCRLVVNFVYNVFSSKGYWRDKHEARTEGRKEEVDKDNPSCLSTVLYDSFGADVEHVFCCNVFELCFELLFFFFRPFEYELLTLFALPR